MIWKKGVNEFVFELKSITWRMQSCSIFIFEVIFATSIAIDNKKETFLHNCNNKLYWTIILNPKNIKTYIFYIVYCEILPY